MLEPLQSAYRPQHSTETALAKVHSDLTKAVDEKKVALLLLLDLSAAFDTIDHELLLDRCEKLFGLASTPLQWLRSYMAERTQRVLVEDASSSTRKLTCGVPQGSVLGPLLFIMYTTPLGDLLRRENIQFHMYADDTQVYAISTLDNIDDTKDRVEQAMEKIRVWMAKNLLKLNPNKTEFLFIHNNHQVNDFIQELNVSGEIIKPSDHAKNIGVIFDSTLSMDRHVSAMTKTLNFHLRNIARARRYLTKEATETIVHALFTSRLDYGNSLLAMQPACRLRRLQLAQNTAARIVCKLPRYDHITPVLKTLHWLPVAQRITYKLCVLMYKGLHGLAPEYIQEMAVPHEPSRSLRSASLTLLHVPRTRTAYGDRSLAVAGPRAWNSLPKKARNCADYEHFKKVLKTHLFKTAYGTE